MREKMKGLIKKIQIEAFAQATEDTEKVSRAIRNLIPPDLREIKFSMEKVRGVFHNPIIIIRTTFSEGTEGILEYLAQNLGEADKQYLTKSLERRIQSGNLYIRFGKQELYKNKLKIKETQDTVKARISFSNRYAKPEKLMQLLQEMELIDEKVL
jgi:RNA binding exosome subunit